jgi:tripartite-type tricarboxylate transporter receptor subunit TctC
VSASQRLPLLPDVPPFSEAAGAPDYEGVSWHMLLMPSKTPRPIVERLHTEMKRIMAAPDMREKIAPSASSRTVDRGDARLHRVRAREMGRAGQAARSRGLAIGPGDERDSR